MISFLIVLLNVCFAALPPTTLRGNAESTKPTTFNIEVPFYQATTSAAVTRRIETGNNNMLVNPSFEATAGTTGHSFGTTASVSSTDLVDGNKALSFALTTFSGTLASQTVVPTGSFGGLNFEVSLNAKSSVGSLEVCGTSNGNVIQCNDVPAGSLWSYVPTNMPGVAAGTFGYLLRTKNNVAVTGTVGIDAAYVGRARNLAEVSQTTQYGKVSTPGTTNCGWTNSSPSTSFASFSADADCPTATATGYASAPSTKIPAITFASLPPGKYYFVARLSGDYFAIDGASETDIGGAFRFTDGTNNFGGLNLRCIQASFCSASEFSGEIEYTSPQSNVTIQIQGRETLAAVTNLYINNGVTAVPTTFEISVYRYPTQNEIAARTNTIPGNWSGYHDSTCLFSRTNTAYGDYTADASCALVELANNNFGPVTASGSVLPAITFTPTRTGRYFITANASAGVSVSGANSAIQMTDGTTVFAQQGFSNDGSYITAVNLQGILNVTNLSAKTITLQAKSSSGDSLIAGSYNGMAVVWNIVYLDQGFPAPVFQGSVTTNGSGQRRFEDAFITCTASSSATNTSSNWLTVGNRSSSACSITISPAFTSSPNCFAVRQFGTTAAEYVAVNVTSSSALTLYNSTAGDFTAYLFCQGPR